MSFNLQKSPFLPQQKEFPNEEVANLSNAIFKAYIDIANRVNEREIGLYAPGYDVVTGKTYYLGGNSTGQKVLRRVVQITGPGSYPHGANLSGVNQSVKIYGSFFDTNTSLFHPLPYVDVVNVTNQIGISYDDTDVIVTAGAGTPPTITNGTVVIEWLSPL